MKELNFIKPKIYLRRSRRRPERGWKKGWWEVTGLRLASWKGVDWCEIVKVVSRVAIILSFFLVFITGVWTLVHSFNVIMWFGGLGFCIVGIVMWVIYRTQSIGR